MMGDRILDRAGLLAALSDTRHATRDVPVPEFGDGAVVRVREMSGALRARLEAAIASSRAGTGDARALERVTVQILAYCIVGSDGRPMLREEDARQLMTRSPRAAYRLRDAVFAISALDEGDMEAIAEGFSSDQSGDSTTA